MNVNFVILDYNEYKFIFLELYYKFIVLENLLEKIYVGLVVVIDKDMGLNVYILKYLLVKGFDIFFVLVVENGFIFIN